MGYFQAAFKNLVRAHGQLFEMVTYDAGVLSEANGKTVVDAKKDYLFALKNEHRTMFKLASELLAAQEVVARTVDVLDNKTTVTRTLKLLAVDPSWSYDDSKGPEESVWRHAQAFLAVESVRLREGVVVENEVRLFVSSRAPERLTPSQWLYTVRAHWGVENNNHNTLDTAFAEDDWPWIEADEHGMLAVLVLRRIAYTLLALFKAVTQRSEEKRPCAGRRCSAGCATRSSPPPPKRWPVSGLARSTPPHSKLAGLLPAAPTSQEQRDRDGLRRRQPAAAIA